MKQFNGTKGNWKQGKHFSYIVSNVRPPRKTYTEDNYKSEKEYYGGYLVCESIARKEDADLLSAAPKMLEALQNLENDANQIPEHAWKMVQDAISCALGNEA